MIPKWYTTITIFWKEIRAAHILVVCGNGVLLNDKKFYHNARHLTDGVLAGNVSPRQKDEICASRDLATLYDATFG